MGYHVTILRTQGSTVIPIGAEEMERAVSSRPEFRLTRDVRGEPVVEFTDCGDPPPCVWYSDGEWWTKNPDEATVDAMCRLAALLDARVRGDELETYRSSADVFQHPDDAPGRLQSEQMAEASIRKSRKRSFILHACIAGVFVVLGLLASTCSRDRKPGTGTSRESVSTGIALLAHGGFDGDSLLPWDCEEGMIVQDGDNRVLEVTLDGGVFGLRQDFQWPGGKQALTLSFRVKADNASEAAPIQLRARLFDREGNSEIIATRSVIESGKWLEVNAAVERPGFAPVSFMIESNRGEGNLRIDDVALE